MASASPNRVKVRRLPILWIVLAALLFVSLLPMLLLQRRVMTLTEDTVISNEKLQQTEITRLIAEEILLYELNLRNQLINQRQNFSLTGVRDINSPKDAPRVAALLEAFAKENPEILYVAAIGKNLKGPGAGTFRAETDPFVAKALQRGFTWVQQEQKQSFRSEPLALGAENRPAVVIALPLYSGEAFAGMLGAVVSLDRILARLQEVSTGGREVYLVDRAGRIVAHPDTRKFVPGTDVTTLYDVVAQFRDLPQEQRVTSTISFAREENGGSVDYVGTYSAVPELPWGVIAQRSLQDVREVARITDLVTSAKVFAVVTVFFALVMGYLFAVGIASPVHSLAEATRAISRGDFSERVPEGGTAELSELATTFNKMADDIGTYIEQLKQAAEENRELFVGSIRMLAAAIDEKDPYTRGHSGRVAKYSVIVGEALGLGAEELDKLRVSALLHDVGKIGVDDRVLKKPGSLTPEEFEIMKQHPVKGANIMRPVAQLKEMLPGIELHHESMDGRGYPYGLSGDQIPIMARVISVADTLDAMTTNRPYQSAMDLSFAVGRIRQLTGTKFDPQVVDALEAAIASGKLKLSATLVEV